MSPPKAVLAAFGLHSQEPVPAPAGWESGYLVGDVVVSPVADRARATWSARVRDSLAPAGLRVARPFRATDSRTVVSDWRADLFIKGQPEARFDETIATSLRRHIATYRLERPRFLTNTPVEPWEEVDYFTTADRAAFADSPIAMFDAESSGLLSDPRPDRDLALSLYGEIAKKRTDVVAPAQIVHGDLLAGTLYEGAIAPGINDIVPYWRSPSWAAAVVAVDGLSWGGADDGLIDRWQSLPEWHQQLLRALLFRLGVHILHPESEPEEVSGLTRAAEVVLSRL